MMTRIARWIKTQALGVRRVGVSASGAPARECSWGGETFLRTNSIYTISKGIGVQIPPPEALEELKGLVIEILLFEDPTTLQAMRMKLGPSGLVRIEALERHMPSSKDSGWPPSCAGAT